MAAMSVGAALTVGRPVSAESAPRPAGGSPAEPGGPTGPGGTEAGSGVDPRAAGRGVDGTASGGTPADPARRVEPATGGAERGPDTPPRPAASSVRAGGTDAPRGAVDASGDRPAQGAVVGSRAVDRAAGPDGSASGPGGVPVPPAHERTARAATANGAGTPPGADRPTGSITLGADRPAGSIAPGADRPTGGTAVAGPASARAAADCRESVGAVGAVG
ncbi:hypothetical protein EAO71_36420, partial [Streptomyces sp. ms191]